MLSPSKLARHLTCVLLTSAMGPALGCVGMRKQAVSASQQLYVRRDSDHTTILSPRTEVAANLTEEVRLQGSYAVDAWTGASIDVRTAATAAIFETRHELNVQGSYGQGDSGQGAPSLTAGYRYSLEPDYISHGGVLSGQLDFAQHHSTLALDTFFGQDDVGRAGDPGFSQVLRSGGTRLSYSQVLDEDTLAQVSYEAMLLKGFQSSVYRYVAIGGDGTCKSRAPYCLPELVPEVRLRHALAARLRRSLTSWLSLGLQYRLYVDSWGLQSHTLSPQLAATPSRALTLRWDYRFYTQGAADFYRARYADVSGVDGYRTRDRKLSPLFTHSMHLSAELRHEPQASTAPVWAFGMRLGVSRLRYRAFVGLQHVYALELATFVGLEFE